MDDLQYSSPSAPANKNPFGNIFAFFLLATGTIIGLWIFLNIYQIFNNPERLSRFQQLIAQHLELIISSKKGNMEIVIPKEILEYFIPIALFMIAAGVAATFISGGINLLQGSLHKLTVKFSNLENKIENAMHDLGTKIDETMNPK